MKKKPILLFIFLYEFISENCSIITYCTNQNPNLQETSCESYNLNPGSVYANYTSLLHLRKVRLLLSQGIRNQIIFLDNFKTIFLQNLPAKFYLPRVDLLIWLQFFISYRMHNGEKALLSTSSGFYISILCKLEVVTLTSLLEYLWSNIYMLLSDREVSGQRVSSNFSRTWGSKCAWAVCAGNKRYSLLSHMIFHEKQNLS